MPVSMSKLIDYLQQLHPHSQPSPVHSSPQVHSVSHDWFVQHDFCAQQVPLQPDWVFLLLSANKTLLPAMMANDANKTIFFFMILIF
jgi:hypothetical protein